MIDIKLLRETPDVVRDALKNRGSDLDLQAVLDADAERRRLTFEFEQLRAEQNRASDEIARLKRDQQDATEAISAMKEISGRIKELDEARRGMDITVRDLLLAIPNVPDEGVPVGADDSANRVERQWGIPAEFDFKPKDHVALGESLGILDFDCAAKLTGARFCVSRGAGARLERALINLMLDIHTREHGYMRCCRRLW